MDSSESLIDRIYEAATDPERWPSVLRDLGRATGSAGAVLLTRRSDQWMGWRFSDDFPKDMISGLDAYLRSDAAARSQTTARLVEFNRSGFVTNDELFTDEEYRADTFVTDWSAPNDMHHSAATAIHMPTGDFVVVQVQRRVGQPALGRGDVDRLDRFRPHLARASLLASRWRLERLRAAAEALALIGLPAAILDFGGRVLAANALIQGLDRYVVWRPGDQISFADPAASSLLRQAMAQMTDRAALSARSFPARSAGTEGAVVVHLVPIAGSARDLFEGGASVLVVTPVSASQTPDIALIQGLFDLTPAEARVAGAIGEGLTIDQIATRQSVARETVRTQVKAVLLKTGAHHQSEVTALLAGLPRNPAGPR